MCDDELIALAEKKTMADTSRKRKECKEEEI